MKVKRLLLGESESIVTTGMPAAAAESMASRISSGSAADTRMPAGGICRWTTARNSSFSAFGSYVSGPTISTLTPRSRPAACKPSAASCQYAIFVLATTRTYASVASCRPPPQAHSRDIATATRDTGGLPTMSLASLLSRLPSNTSIRPPMEARNRPPAPPAPFFLQPSQPRLQFRRQRGHHDNRIPRRRLPKLDAVRVQEVAPQVRLRGRPVERIPHHRMLDARQMDPDLVRAARPDAYLQQGETREPAQHAILARRRAAFRQARRHARAMPLGN